MQKIIIFDIDGTLAKVDHRRPFLDSKPKNWKAFNDAMPNDTVYEDIRFILLTFWEEPTNKIILCSGRDELFKNVTINWLNANDIPYHDLYMRPAKNNEKDSIVKVDLLNKIRMEHGEPYLWFDDRDQVVHAIREQGIRVLQVCHGAY